MKLQGMSQYNDSQAFILEILCSNLGPKAAVIFEVLAGSPFFFCQLLDQRLKVTSSAFSLRNSVDIYSDRATVNKVFKVAWKQTDVADFSVGLLSRQFHAISKT